MYKLKNVFKTYQNNSSFNHALDDINLDIHTINIKTDAQNTKSLGNYGVLVGSLTVADLVTTKPIIEIICVNESTYSFYIDVVK